MSSFSVVLGCVMALLIIFFTISSIARYYIKFTLFAVLCLMSATLPMPLMLIKPFDPKNALIPAALLMLTAKFFGLRWTVRGQENVDNSRGTVVLINHQSCLDLYTLSILWPLIARGTVVAKRSLQYLVPFGTATWLWGTVFIDRGTQSARGALNKQVDAIKNEKEFISKMSSFSVVLGCVMALLIIFFTISSIARYYIKFTLFAVLCLMSATLPMPLMLIKPFDPKNALIPAALLMLTAKFFGLRWTVRGQENVDNSRGTVVLINHQSCLDLYTLSILWPLIARGTVVAKRSLQYLVPFGTATWLWGTVFIDRGTQSARGALNKQVDAIKNEKRKLLLFPEGTRHSGEKLLPFRKGAFHVAMDAAAPIQPIVVSRYHFLDDKRHRFGSGDFIVSILPMIETKGMSKDDIDSLIESTWQKMQEEYTKISTETLELHSLRSKAE